MEKKSLPEDNSSFSDIRKYDCYYVDKTHLIYKMVLQDKENITRYYFLSRPRRFGKSLLIDTIKCLFEGKKELFKDLYIYDKWDFDKNTHPVIRLDFSKGKYYEVNGLKNYLHECLKDIENQPQPPFRLIWKILRSWFQPPPVTDVTNPDNYNYRLTRIIQKLYSRHNKQVVVLIDEYDAPITDALIVNQELAESNRRTLGAFFRVLKANQEYIRFVFITGVSMFPLTDMSSGLNNLADITFNPDYSTICGFTEKELITVFAPELKNLKLKDISLDEIRKYYNGYGWRSMKENIKENRVYNPYSIVLLFVYNEIDDWWYQSSKTNFFYDLLKKGKLTPFEIGSKAMTRHQLSTIDIDELDDPQALYFQMGILTITRDFYDQSENKRVYILDYPNEEIRKSFLKGSISKFFSDKAYTKTISKAKIMVSQLEKNDFIGLQQTIKAYFAGFPYPNKPTTKELKNIQQNKLNQQLDEDLELKKYEFYYSSLLSSAFDALGVKITKEVRSAEGISDLEIELGNQVFILELKMLRIKDIEQSLNRALKQITNNKYTAPHKYADNKVHGIAMVFDKDQGNIVGLKHKVFFAGKKS